MSSITLTNTYIKKRAWCLLDFIKVRRDRFISLSFYIVFIALIGLYHPIYAYLSRQEVKVTINISEMTVFYIIFLLYMGYFADKILTRFTAGKPYIYRLAGLFIFILALVALLDAVGMTMRWD